MLSRKEIFDASEKRDANAHSLRALEGLRYGSTSEDGKGGGDGVIVRIFPEDKLALIHEDGQDEYVFSLVPIDNFISDLHEVPINKWTKLWRNGD